MLYDWKSQSVYLTTGAANAWFLHGQNCYQNLPVKGSMGAIKAVSNLSTKLSNNLSFFSFSYILGLEDGIL